MQFNSAGVIEAEFDGSADGGAPLDPNHGR
jgi:hypothetical protein